MTINDQENILDKEYAQPKNSFNKAQEKALKLILDKESAIQKTQEEIEKLLRENDLHERDLNEYKRRKKVDEFINMKIPG